MGNRRMLSKKITSSAKFLKMPLETQALYFHLAQHADDDGIVEGFTIMRLIGSSEDSLKVLEVKQYIKVLNEDLVLFIVDWLEHNSIRPDRKVDSIYKNLLLEIMPEVKLIEPRERKDRIKKDDLGTSHGPSMDGLSKDKLSKVKLSKVNKKHMHGEYKKVRLTEKEFEKLKADYTNADELIKFLDEYIEMKGYKAKNHNLAIRKWVVDAVKEKKIRKEKLKTTKKSNIEQVNNFKQREYEDDEFEQFYS